MLKPRIVKVVETRIHFRCEMCNNHKNAKMYEYRGHSYVEGYTPKYFKKVCEDCVYRECYGSKNWRIKKREGSLNDTSK